METIMGIVTNVWTMFGNTISEFNDAPVLWLPCAFGVVGACIGLVKRATRIGGRSRR